METLRARVITFKSRFIQKVLSYRVLVNDAEKPTIKTTITVFLPKLKLRHLRPCVFLHMHNGNGSVLSRCSSPLLLAEKLEELAADLRSSRFLDEWDHLNDLVDRLSCNEDVIFDEKYFDQEDFKTEIIEHEKPGFSIEIRH